MQKPRINRFVAPDGEVRSIQVVFPRTGYRRVNRTRFEQVSGDHTVSLQFSVVDVRGVEHDVLVFNGTLIADDLSDDLASMRAYEAFRLITGMFVTEAEAVARDLACAARGWRTGRRG
jgi:hypothetical protein